jgi:hypothetical protein
MKSKKIDKKLFLNKTTVANLNNGEMTDIHAGGVDYKETLENSCCLICGGTTTCPSESFNCPVSNEFTVVFTCNDPCVKPTAAAATAAADD